MLMIEEMLKTLQKEYSPKNYQDYNNEHDFSKVLNFALITLQVLKHYGMLMAKKKFFHLRNKDE